MIEVELPDGTIAEIDTDDPNVAASAAKKFIGSSQAAKPAARGFWTGAAQGVTDPLIALGQIGIGIREKLGIPSSVSGEQAKNIIQQRESDIAASRGPDAGFDWARTVGNVAAAAPLAAIPGGPITGSILAGGLSGLMQPAAGEGDLASQKAVQAGLGAAAGGLGGGAARLVAGLVGGARGAVPGAVEALGKEGVTPTIGQAAGGMAKNAEEALASLPFAGAPIREAQRRGTESLNVAAYNRALAPIGEKITPGKLGGEAVAEVSSKLSDAYKAIQPRLNFKPTSEFLNDMAAVAQTADDLPEAQASHLVRLAKSFAKSKDFKEGESKLNHWVSQYSGSSDPDQRALGGVLENMRSTLRDHLAKQNPAEADKLRAINEGWANYARVRDAASGIGTEENVFTAAQLQAAVRKGDKSVGKGNFAKGQALMQDLSQPAKQLMSRPFPTSGTMERSSYANPFTLGEGALGYLATKPLYSPAGQRLITALVTSRSPDERALAEIIRRSGAGAGLASSQLVPSEPY